MPNTYTIKELDGNKKPIIIDDTFNGVTLEKADKQGTSIGTGYFAD